MKIKATYIYIAFFLIFLPTFARCESYYIPGSTIDLGFDLANIDFKNYDLEIYFINEYGTIEKTKKIRLSNYRLEENAEEKFKFRAVTPKENGSYRIEAVLLKKSLEKNEGYDHYKTIKSSISRINVVDNSFSTNPSLISDSIDWSRTYSNDKNIKINFSYLPPISGFSTYVKHKTTLYDENNNVVVSQEDTVKTQGDFDNLTIPVSIDNIEHLKSGKYRITTKLLASQNMITPYSITPPLQELNSAEFDVGDIYIVQNTYTNAESKVLHISEFGAFPNDDIDDTIAIINAISELKKRNNVVLEFSEGEYNYSKVIRIENLSHFAVVGRNTKLVSSDHNNSAIIFNHCSDFTISGFHIISEKNELRRQEFEKTGISILNSKNFTVKNNLIYRSAAAGLVIARGSSYFQIHDNVVLETKADAIHTTGASAYGLIYNNITDNSGDDGIAVISYINPKGVSHNIKIFNNNILGNSHGRGIAVGGGSDISISNNRIAETDVAGILIAADYFYSTFGAKNISITNNSITSACRDPMNAHSALLVYGRSSDKARLKDYDNIERKELFLDIENIAINGNIIDSENCNGKYRLGPHINKILLQ
ncbi:right-handed parallel beta-helix repeat-containing protein [Aestuariibacter sp. A3R04]|uniref:right-handed parallel beta-helix repeat-containing protein n=1 Tax=Aestuariibacter sp. A3R04 TaxID=2841571 RepID=UPI001C09BE87|nr:right-handed parallel beta-helix repeat-containing protein [Aestuariibacter sp. A3R04]MBU3023747.1 right-handed parallel beta-helix repeat-containing protein [Aestuariibacter sp. A3R04]